jgi:hypothetical protein
MLHLLTTGYGTRLGRFDRLKGGLLIGVKRKHKSTLAKAVQNRAPVHLALASSPVPSAMR